MTLGAVGTTTIGVSTNLSSVSSQLSSFVTAYNAAFAEVQKNTGQNGGALVGDSTVLEMQAGADANDHLQRRELAPSPLWPSSAWSLPSKAR